MRESNSSNPTTRFNRKPLTAYDLWRESKTLKPYSEWIPSEEQQRQLDEYFKPSA